LLWSGLADPVGSASGDLSRAKLQAVG
jgi:hypothetical protein